MEITLNNKKKELVQLRSTDSEIPKGLYFIPVGTIELFEAEVEKYFNNNTLDDPQFDFDIENSVGAQRVFAYDSYLNI